MSALLGVASVSLKMVLDAIDDAPAAERSFLSVTAPFWHWIAPIVRHPVMKLK